MNRSLSTAVTAAALVAGLLAVPSATAAPSTTRARTGTTAGAVRTPFDRPVSRLIVKTRDGRVATTKILGATTSLSGASPASVLRRMSHGQSLVRLGRAVSVTEAWKVAHALERRADVVYAEPDLWVYPTGTPSPITPNDPAFASQWDLWDASAATPAGGYSSKAPASWGRTTGRSAIVVAVIDTGLTIHPDVTSSVTAPTGSDPIVAGYDFVGLDDLSGGPPNPPDLVAYTANDGNGRDSNPSDPGDWITASESAGGDATYGDFFQGCPQDNSSWHGTHVTGTIVGRQDNGIGISGIAPGVKVQPVRALGKCGGYSSDIDDAIEWASGGTVGGVPANATPAKVINMSLGGPGACLASTQTAINDARSRGTTVVVAAGNSGATVQPSTAGSTTTGSQPASCAGVITVTASTRTGTLATYSNFGTVAGNVTIAAQGGAGDGTNDVLSTVNPGTQSPGDANAALPADIYARYAGTSMATPHVAAAVALIQSRLTTPFSPDQVKARLIATATPFPGAAGCTTIKCGAGIVNIGAALPDPPGAPTGVSASPSNSSAFLTWTPPASTGGAAVTGYKVMGSVDGGPDAPVVGDTGSTVPSLHVTRFADATPLTNTHTYSFTVAAINGVGVGSSATSNTVAPAASTPPDEPVAPTVTGGVERLAITWIAPASPSAPITEYGVRYRRVGATSWICQTGTLPDCRSGTTTTTASVAPWPNGSLPGGRYEVQIAAVNTVGASVWSPSGSAVVAALTQTVTVSATTLRPFRDRFQDSVVVRVGTNRPGGASGSLRILNAKLVPVKIVPLTARSSWAVVWTGLNARNARVPNGRYYVQVLLSGRSSRPAALPTRPSVIVASSQASRPAITLSSTTVFPVLDRFLDTVTISSTATVPSVFTYRITSAGRTRWSATQSRRLKGAVVWSGRTSRRAALPAGRYVVYVTAKGGEGIAVTSFKYVVVSLKRVKAVAFRYDVVAAASHVLGLQGSFHPDSSGGGYVAPDTVLEFAPTLPTSVKPLYHVTASACSARGGESTADARFAYLGRSTDIIPGTVTLVGNAQGFCWSMPNAGNTGPAYTPAAAVFSGRVHILIANVATAPDTGRWYLTSFRLTGTRYLLV